MTEYLTEQEQIEILKNWVKQYSLIILIGVAISISVITGWRFYQERQTKFLSHAAMIYEELLSKRAQNDIDAINVSAQRLFQHYPKTVYGQMAALMLARNAIIKNNDAQAETFFRWVIDHSHVTQLRQIARMRLARLLIAEQKPDVALTTLEKIDDHYFSGLINEIRGDAYLAQKNPVKAHEAYAEALKELPNAESIRPLLQMKYDNLTTAS